MEKILITTQERDYQIDQNRKWIGLLGLLAIIIYLPAVYHFTHHLSNWHIIFPLIAVPVAVIIGCWVNKIWFEIMFECIPGKTFMIDKNGVTLRFIEDVWIKHQDYYNLTNAGKYPIISYASEMYQIDIRNDIIMGTQPIMLRKFKYKLVFVQQEGIENAITLRNLIQRTNMSECNKQGNSTESLCWYIAHEFLTKKVTELSTLYNPVDEKQQEKFRKIFATFLKEFCAGDCLQCILTSEFKICEE